MTLLSSPRRRRAALLAVASVAAAAALAPAVAATPPGARTAAAVDPKAPRTGAYTVVKIGEKEIHARCLEGGNVFVAAHPAPGAAAASAKPAGPRPRGISAERDAALRSACQAVDYTK